MRFLFGIAYPHVRSEVHDLDSEILNDQARFQNARESEMDVGWDSCSILAAAQVE